MAGDVSGISKFGTLERGFGSSAFGSGLRASVKIKELQINKLNIARQEEIHEVSILCRG